MTAAGVGLTLTAASSVIFAELHWTPGVLAQAEDRCHRIGQTNAVNIMFCVCKDPDISVDLSLWKMLGRKVNNLGRMIDGKKGLSMDAIDAEKGTPSEQELSSFFAETCPSDTGKNIAVKGSIQSFFSSKTTHTKKGEKRRTTRMEKEYKKSRTQEKMTTHTQYALFEKAPKVHDLTHASRIPRITHESKSLSSPISWTCTICTYINEEIKLTSTPAKLVCRMCRTPCDDQPEVIREYNIATKPKYLPPSLSSDGKLRMGKNKNTNTSLELEVIEISDDSDEDVKLPPSKRQKYKPVLESKRKPHSSPVICLDLDVSPDELAQNIHTSSLSFCVSKNSGRIAVCDADSGESLLVNFDIEDVIHETTSEEILTKQLKRIQDRHHGLCPSQILFEDCKVEKGKNSKGNEICFGLYVVTNFRIN